MAAVWDPGTEGWDTCLNLRVSPYSRVIEDLGRGGVGAEGPSPGGASSSELEDCTISDAGRLLPPRPRDTGVEGLRRYAITAGITAEA